MTMQSPSRKAVVVPLDTSDVINLDHLDVIPCQFRADLNKSIANVDLDSEAESLLSPKSPVYAAKTYQGTPPQHQDRPTNVRNDTREVTTGAPLRPRKSPKTVFTKGYDRRGRMTRIVADCIDDSDSLECYKQARLTNKLQQLRKRRSIKLTDIFSGSSCGTPPSPESKSSSGSSRTERPDSLEANNYPPEIKSEHGDVTEAPSEALIQLNEALKQLESTCSDDNTIQEEYRSPYSPLTLPPNRMNPLVGPSSSYWRNMMMTSGKYHYQSPLQQKLSHAVSFAPTNPASLEQFVFSVPSNMTYEGAQDLSPQAALSHQKTAAIWEWVSPKYACELPSATFPVPSCMQKPTDSHETQPDSTANDSPAAKPSEAITVPAPKLGPPIPSNLLRSPIGRSFSDATRFAGGPLKAFERARLIQNVQKPPTPVIIKPPPQFDPAPPSAASGAEKLTPPGSSTIWNHSPIYSGTNLEVQAIRPHDSNCSLTPAIHSVASLGDVRSGDDIATISTASTFTDVEAKAAPQTPADSQILELIGQISNSVGKVPTKCDSGSKDEGTPLITRPITNGPQEPVKPIVHSKATVYDPSVVELSPVKPRRSISPCSVTASDLQFRKIMESVGEPKQTYSGTRTNDHARKLEAFDSPISMFNQPRKRNKKGKRLRKFEPNGDSCDFEVQEMTKRRPKDRITQTARGKPTIYAIPSESVRLQRLKKALPRTPGGSYAFRNRAAEAAIAEYVKAELAASLLPNPKPEKHPKPRVTQTRSFLNKVTSSDYKCGCRGCGGPANKMAPPVTIKLPPKSKVLLAKKSSGAHSKPPFKPTDNFPRLDPVPPLVPKVSARINYLKYQQQSLAALIGKNRASRQALVSGAVLGNTRMPLSYSYLSLYPKDFQTTTTTSNECGNLSRTNRMRGNRNNVTVVFGDSPSV